MTKEDVEVMWGGIIKHARALQDEAFAYGLRARYTTNHTEEERSQERADFDKNQLIEWLFIKNQYVLHRELLLGAKNDDKDRIEISEAIERILTAEFESVVFKTNVDE